MQIAHESLLLAAVLVFVAVLLAIESLVLFWRGRKRGAEGAMANRLQRLAQSRLRAENAAVLNRRDAAELPLVRRLLLARPGLAQLDRLLAQSGLGWSLTRLLVACACSACVGFVTGVAALRSPGAALLTAAVFAFGPFAYVSARRTSRMLMLERQLPDLLDHLTRALRAGHGLAAALKMAGDEMPEPIAGEFRVVHDEINYGISLQRALENLSQRVALGDVRMFVVAVVIQRDTDGNLTEVLQQLSQLIRGRLRLLGKVKVLSTEGRMSAWVLGVLPFALGGGMYVVNPEFMSTLWTDPMGVAITRTMLVLMAIGIWLTRRIVRIRV